MNATYREMAKLRTLYPTKEIDVLNIIGNIGGNSDGIVKNASSLSLEYLVAPMAKSYFEASSFLNLIIMMLLFIKIVKPDTPCGLKFDN